MTDYAKIAPQYDRNPIRRQIPPDELIAAMLATSSGRLAVLDLACGTGNYLVAQEAQFADARIDWYGVDLSTAMLAQARTKQLRAKLVQASADNLPFADGFFDFVKIRFAHHHFPDKAAAFREVYRVLRPGGSLSIFNICHEYAKRPWVYHFFPETRQIDVERFPTVRELYNQLACQGFYVKADIQVSVALRSMSALVEEAENRDMSQLHQISDASWEAGLAAMRADAARMDGFLEDTALLNIACTK